MAIRFATVIVVIGALEGGIVDVVGLARGVMELLGIDEVESTVLNVFEAPEDVDSAPLLTPTEDAGNCVVAFPLSGAGTF